jgi:murein L,D-transpeptidase YcbB/YkuD
MRKIAMALLATAVIGSPAIAASNNQQPQNQQPQTQYQPSNSQGQNQSKNNQMQNQSGRQAQSGSNNQSAENQQPISPHSLSRASIKQVQQALQQSGFKSGPADGRWGPETENAVKQFQHSKQIHANGQLDQQTVADLGLDASKFQQSGNQQ